MTDELLPTAIVAIAFALIHIFGKYMRFLAVTPRSIWLSLAGGVSLAYVFAHLLPELAAQQEEALVQGGWSEASALGQYVYLTALAGVLIFYGIDRFARQASLADAQSGTRERQHRVFWVHLGSYALYSILIGYLLVHREDNTLDGLFIYTLALGFHFIVNDQGLRRYHGSDYDNIGRWILAAAPIAGWVIGVVYEISPLALATLFGLLAGSIILNVLKEELPDDRESRFWALGLGAVGFSTLLLLSP